MYSNEIHLLLQSVHLLKAITLKMFIPILRYNSDTACLKGEYVTKQNLDA